MTAPSKDWVYVRLLAAFVVSSPANGLDICLMCVVRWTSLRRADHMSRGVLPTVLRRRVWSGSLKNEEVMSRVGPQLHGGGEEFGNFMLVDLEKDRETFRKRIRGVRFMRTRVGWNGLNIVCRGRFRIAGGELWTLTLLSPVVTSCTSRLHKTHTHRLHLIIPRSAHTVYLCVLCGSQNKQRLFPYTA